MADNLGLKIGIEGEKEFKKALSEINQSFKVLGSEMKLVSSQFDKNDKSVQALSARNTVLNKEIEAQKNKVESSEWVFPSPTGGPMSPDSVLHMLQRVLKRAGLPRIRFHDLRHPYVKHTTKKFNSEKQKTQATKIVDLIAWVFCFCIVSYSKRSWTL